MPLIVRAPAPVSLMSAFRRIADIRGTLELTRRGRSFRADRNGR
jgi:hypothetical protein